MTTIQEVYPYLRVHDSAAAIEFYRRAFGAEELFRLCEPSGRIGHAEVRIGPATVMLSDEYPERGISGPRSLGGTTFSLHLHVEDVDAAFDRAVGAGATVVRPLQDQFYGERSGTVRDPFGHEWLLGGHIEDVTTEEMQRRYTALFRPS
ncbi:MAG TPA: VOC family protein [Stellaceae bacterium]|nr:VOC family protein [Stellaceae bacterium]